MDGRTAPAAAEKVQGNVSSRTQAMDQPNLNTTGEEPRRRKSQADTFVQLVTDDGTQLFHDQLNEPFARIKVGDHWETHRVGSKAFRRWGTHLFWQQEGKVPHSNALTAALNILEGMATCEGPRLPLSNRVAWHLGSLWIDMTDDKWSAIQVTADGWQVVQEPPILFHRYSHQEALPAPAQGGDIKTFLPYVNMEKEEQKLLLLVYIVSCFIPDMPHPIPILYGPQGASKTTLAKMLRRMVDPSSIGTLSLPSNPPELVQQLSHHWFVFFDNITGLPCWVSDALCRAVTGEGFSKRELYTNDDDIIYTFQRCVALNGINLAAQKPDLLDRGVLFKLGRISQEQRRAESELWGEFNSKLPAMLGGVLDVLVRAIALRPSIQVPRVPRMADFTLWGCAIAKALGHSQDDFLSAYFANIGEQHEEAVNESPVATAVRAFMEERDSWTGTPSELLQELLTVAEAEKIDTRASSWPKAANSLSRKLNEAKTNLGEIGIAVDAAKGTAGRRTIIIHKGPRNIADIAPSAASAEHASSEVSPTPPPESPLVEGPPTDREHGSGDSGDIPLESLPF